MFTTAVDKLLSQFFALSAEERSCILEVLVDSQPINNSDGVESFLSKRLDVSRSGRPACPHCGSLKVVKNGRHCGTQRFICRDCSKSFGWSSGSFFNHCRKEISQWFKYVECFMDRLPLRECARRCGISLDTSFKWRHRLLDGLQKIHNSVKLTGVVEADEVYFSISYKGSRKFSAQHAGREPKKRGMRSTKRGLSDEKVCVPTAKSIFRHTWEKGAQYLKKMGGIIMIASIIIWFLGYYPNHDAYETVAEQQENSYIGQLGRGIEPVIKPLGFDWKLGIGLLSGVGAKELVVSTLGVLYADDPDADSVSLAERIPITPLVAFCYMLFVLIYFPCIAALAAIKQESGSWKWALFAACYTTGLAWLVSFAVYQIGGLFV